MYGFETVAAITAICFAIAEAIKLTALDEKWLPVICGALGAVLGFVGWKFLGLVPADDVFTAIVIGIESGLAATGAHQIYKQQVKGD